MHCNELLTTDRIANRRCSDRRANIEIPQWLQFFVVERRKRAVERAGEDEATASSQDAGIVRVIGQARGLDFACRHIHSCHLATHPILADADSAIPEWAAHAGVIDFELPAAIDASAVSEVLCRVPRGREEIHSALP